MVHFYFTDNIGRTEQILLRNALQPKTVFDHSVRMPPRFLLWKTGFFFCNPLDKCLALFKKFVKCKK